MAAQLRHASGDAAATRPSGGSEDQSGRAAVVMDGRRPRGEAGGGGCAVSSWDPRRRVMAGIEASGPKAIEGTGPW